MSIVDCGAANGNGKERKGEGEGAAMELSKVALLFAFDVCASVCASA